MKLRRAVAFSVAAALLASGLWVVGGKMWAARAEERCDKEWTAIFESLDDLEKKHPKRETNETAKKLEALTRGSSFDLTSDVRRPGSPRRGVPPAEARSNQAILDYAVAEITKGEAVVDPPPEDIARFFEEKRTQLDAIESTLIASPTPQWSLDISLSERESPPPNLLGHIRLQRVLMARALAVAHGGNNDAAARLLGASWNLNESLWTRPETISVLMAMAGAHLQVGVLRKVNVDERLWNQRLSALDSRRSLLGALMLESRPRSAKNSLSHASTSGDDPSWYQRSQDFLTRPMYRLAMVDYSNLLRDEFAQLRGAPLSDHFPEPPTPDVRDVAHILIAVSMPNTKNAFVRADRLIVDAELTSKILEAKRLRSENGGRWPAAIPGIETSRFPGASWRYEVSPDGGWMSISFSRELASPYGQGMKPLPSRFSSN